MAGRTTTKKQTTTDINAALMPQDIAAEEAVLGAILVNPSVMPKVVESINAESFYKPAHRYVFEAMLQLFNQNQMIDIVSVSDVLSYSSRLELVGGRAFINDLAFKTVTTANVGYYAKIIQDKSIKRALITAGSEIVASGYDQDNVDDSLENAEKLIFDISSQKSTKDFIPVKEDVFNVYSKIEYRYQHRDECTGVRTHFYKLDDMTNGLQKSDLIILAARPSMGKTAFALNIVANVAIKSKVPVAMFSLEMSREQLVQRMMCAEAEVDSQRLRSGNMQSKDWNKLATVMEKFSDVPIYIDDTAGCTLTCALAITGNILFYGKSGFVPAKTKGVRYADDPEADYFLIKELTPGFLNGISGTYKDPEGYFVCEKDPEGFERFEATFPKKEKQKLPGQLF